MPVSPLRGDPPTGEPDAGEPPVRFGGRGKQTQLFLPTPISRSTNRDSSITRVSIHAPARGRDRTAGSYGGRPAYEVSIHAPARGRDVPAGNWTSLVKAVSIHAPARGRDGGSDNYRPLKKNDTRFRERPPESQGPNGIARRGRSLFSCQ